MRDFEAYYAAGSVARAGDDPYGKDIWKYELVIDGVNAARYEVLPFVGPPPSLLIWKTFASLRYAAAMHLWQIVLGLCALLTAVLCGRLCRVRLSTLATLAIALAFLAFGPVTSDLALGQVALPAFAMVVIAVVIARRNAIGAAVAGAVSFIQPNVGITIAALMRDKRGLLIAVLSILLTVEAFALSGGVDAMFSYLQLLQQHGAAERFSAIQITPAAIAYGLGASAAGAQIIGTAVALLATIAWFVAIRKIDSTPQFFAFTCAIAPLSMPFFHEHDLLVTILPALFMAMRCRSPLALAPFFLCSIDWLGLAQRPDGTVQTVLLAASGLLSLAALRGYTRVQVTAPLFIISAAALFGAFAAAHPMPVWPDAMQPYHVPPGATIAQIWEAEQRATGLLAPNVFRSALRVLPLVGCALLSWQLYRLKSTDLEDSKTPYAVPAASL